MANQFQPDVAWNNIRAYFKNKNYKEEKYRVHSSDEEKKQKACEEIWIIARGMPIAFGEEERMKIWSNALYDELMQYDESLRTYYEALEEGGGKLN